MTEEVVYGIEAQYVEGGSVVGGSVEPRKPFMEFVDEEGRERRLFELPCSFFPNNRIWGYPLDDEDDEE